MFTLIYFSFIFQLLAASLVSLIPIQPALYLSSHGYQFFNHTLIYWAPRGFRTLQEDSKEERILIPDSAWQETEFRRQTEDSMPSKKR